MTEYGAQVDQKVAHNDTTSHYSENDAKQYRSQISNWLWRVGTGALVPKSTNPTETAPLVSKPNSRIRNVIYVSQQDSGVVHREISIGRGISANGR